MPLSVAGATAIAGGVQTAGGFAAQLLANRSNRKINEANIKHANQFYDRQRKDSLADYHMRNAYESPQALMQRLKDAKLNPNLAYQQGNFGQSANVNPTSVSAPQQIADNYSHLAGAGQGLGSTILSYYDAQQKSLESKNIAANNLVILNQAKIQEVQIENLKADLKAKGIDYSNAELELAYKSQLNPLLLDAKRYENTETQARTAIALQRNEREALQTASNLSEAVERIANMRATTTRTEAETENIRENLNLLKQEGVLKGLEIHMRENGMTFNDPLLHRLAGQVLSAMAGDDLTSFIQNTIKQMKSTSGQKEITNAVIDFITKTHPVGQLYNYFKNKKK